MLGGGAEVSVGFLKQLQSVFHRHLHDHQADRQTEKKKKKRKKTVSCWPQTCPGRVLQWLELESWRHGWNEFNFSAIKLEVELL